MKIRNAVLVGSNGRWWPVPVDEDGEDTDWVFAADQIGTYINDKFVAPAEQRYIVSAEVDIPEAASVKEVRGEVVKASEDRPSVEYLGEMPLP